MAKQNLLLVDADLRSVRVLEVSLRKAGYNVASAGTAKDALAMLELSRPDLVLCDTRLPTMDGFELIQELRRRPELAGIPLMILSSDVSVETKVRGLELGVEDYLTKPIYIKELLARVNIVLQRKRREGIERLEHGHKRKFSGSLSDMGVVDLLQAIDHNKKSGVLYLTSGSFDGAIYFCNGAPVDAAVGRLRGSRAIYRSLLWTDGTFEIDFREIDREDHVQSSMQAVLMEGLRRVDEWGRLLEQLPNLETVFDVSDTQLMARLAEIPDQINSVLREFDGQRSLWEIVDACDADDLETLSAVSKLYFEGLLYNTGRRPSDADVPEDGPESLPELSDVALPHISSGPPVITHTLAPSWGSVPSDDGSESQLIDDTLQLNIPATPKLPEGLRITPSDAPKRRKARKRKKRTGQSLPATADTTRKHAKSAKGGAKADEAEVRVIDETVAEITPSTIAPPPEDAENAAILQAEQADATTVVVPGTSKPPQLPRSIGAGTAPPNFARPSQTAIHENPTLDLSPIARPATPPPLTSGRPPLSDAAEEAVAAPALKSTAPPPLSAESELPNAAPDFHSDEETTEKQVSLRGSIPPPAVESYVPRKAASPPPLPYVSKPPNPGFGSHRGVTSPGFAAAPVDEETIAAAAAAISDAETAPPPLAAEQQQPKIFAGAAMRGKDVDAVVEGSIPPALRSGSPLQASRSAESDDEAASSVTRTSPAPYPASIPARDFEAAILASIAPLAGDDADIGPDAAGRSAHPSGSSALPEHAPLEAEALRSGAPGASSGENSASASLSPAELSSGAEGSGSLDQAAQASADYDSVAPEPQEDADRADMASRDAHERGAVRDNLESTSLGEPSRDASRPPLTAASMPPTERDDAASARPGATSIPPLATAARDGSVSSRPGSASIPPLPAAFSSPPAHDGSAAADSAKTVSARAGSLSVPPQSAESGPHDHGDASRDEASGIASARPGSANVSQQATSVSPAAGDGSAGAAGGASAPPLAAASVPPDELDDAKAATSRGERAGIASAHTDGLSAPPLAAASVRPDQDNAADAAGGASMSPQAAESSSLAARDSEAAGSLNDAPNVSSARPGGVSAPPLAAASVPPSGLDGARGDAAAGHGGASVSPLAARSVARDDSEPAGSLSEAPIIDSAHAGGLSPLAAASVRPDQDNAADAAGGASMSPQAAESSSPAARDSEAAGSLNDAPNVSSARPGGVTAPPLAAASVRPDQDNAADAAGGASMSPQAAESSSPAARDSEAARSLIDAPNVSSARPGGVSAPPLAAASVRPDQDNAADAAGGASMSPQAAESSSRAARDSEAARSLIDAPNVSSARPGGVTAPPLAAASAPSGERDGSEADASLGVGAGVVSGRSAPPLAAASVPPGERDRLEADALAGRPREFTAPPVAVASVAPGERDVSEGDVLRGAVARDFSAPPLAAASVPAGENQDSERDALRSEESDDLSGRARASSAPQAFEGSGQDDGSRRAASPLLASASGVSEEMDDLALRALSSRTLIEGRDFAVPALAAASLPPGAMADPSDAELVQASLPPSASSAPANDVSEQQKPEEDFSELSVPDERSSSRGAGASQERALPPPLPSTGRRSMTPHTRTSPPPLPYSQARVEADARELGSPPPLATATEPPPGAAALSSPLPPSVDSHTSPGGYVAISPEAESDDTNKRIRAPVQRTAVPPPFTPNAATPNAPAEVEEAERAPSRGVELAANSAPPLVSTVTSSVRPEGTTSSEPSARDARSLSDPSAGWLRDASAPVQLEEEPRVEAEESADARTDQAAQRDRDQANAGGDLTSAAAKASDATESVAPKTSEPTPTASGRPRSTSQRPQKTSNVISFVPRKRAEDAAAAEPLKTASDAAASGVTSGATGAGNAPSQASPQQKRRISRWVQAGGAAATVAIAAGLFALRARDAVPQGSLNTAVPEAVETPPVAPPPAANEVKEPALGELEALQKQAQALPEASPQTASQPSAAAPTGAAPQQAAPTGAPQQAAPTGAAPQQAAPTGAPQQAAPTGAPQQAAPTGAPQQAAPTGAPQQAAPTGAAPQQAAPTEPANQQAAKAANDAQPQAASEPQANAAQVLAKGRSLEQRGKKQDAINLYAKAVEEGNASSQLLSRMAFLYLNQGKNALAETAAQRAAEADETNSEAWIVLGAAQDGLGKKPAAQQAYRNCAQKGQGQYVTECKRMVR